MNFGYDLKFLLFNLISMHLGNFSHISLASRWSRNIFLHY